MNALQKYRSDVKPLLLLLSVFFLARVLFIIYMPAVYSRDLFSWLQVIDILSQGGNPYSQAGVLNWPPFWMQVLYVVHFLSVHIHVSPTLMIQVILIGGEGMTVLLTYILLKRFFGYQKPAKLLIFALALNPIGILLSCQHCNFDFFVGFWILLFTIAILRFYEKWSPVSWLMACFFLGMGVFTKTVPFILAPVLIVGMRKLSLHTVLFGLMLLFTPVLIGMGVIYSLAPLAVKTNVLNYRSMGGWYGITGFLRLLKFEDAAALYRELSPYIILCVMLLLAWRVYKNVGVTKQQLLILILLPLLFIPTFGPGYTPPYISWYFSLLVILYSFSGSKMKVFLVAGYIITMLTYIIEYAFFNSHGAFVTQLFPGTQLASLTEHMGDRSSQVYIRTPMFLAYIVLIILLIKNFKTYTYRD